MSVTNKKSSLAPEKSAGQAVILVNLGTPSAPTPKALRAYLKEFLSDRRVVELPRLLWLFILYVFILPFRPKKSAAKYAEIWTKEGSPLKFHTEKQAKLLQGLLGLRGYENVQVEYAMRYGAPDISTVLSRVTEQRDRVLIFPMYPQYAASTTASASDGVFNALARLRNLPEIRFIRSYCNHPAYISALAASVRAYWAREGKPQRLLMSFHGIPKLMVERGDPYREECLETGHLLAKALNLAENEFEIAFQSRLGRAEWLSPYTADRLASLPAENVRHLHVVCPGFPADCLETLEEIASEGRETFLEAGGEIFGFIPGLNENEAWIAAMADMAEVHLRSWPRFSGADA